MSKTTAFRRRFFPGATDRDWNDWRWQLRHSFKGIDALARILNLSADERRALERNRNSLPNSITPYYASLLDPDDAAHPLRRTMVMVEQEFVRTPEESIDPLSEDEDSPVPGLVHRYPDRVLFLVTGTCPVYCRYCTRSRMVGSLDGDYEFSTKQWERAIEYIAQTPAVRDVLLSGGDPLVLSDDRLEWLLSRLRAIPHVEFLRIGSKVPAVLPQRVTPALARMLRRFHPLWMSLHFIHPDELTPAVQRACARLADAGIPLGSQTPLLAGVNDSLDVCRRLFHGLLRCRVKPYYLYQADLVVGTAHFRTAVSKGLEIIEGLRGHTTGYAVPTFVVDVPGGGGKVPVLPDSQLPREGQHILLQNYERRVFRFPDPQP
ncbi:MAG TPA: KamA family radical SAM protein [Vicinamibacterales bacterium]|nr:KamA family radical SAM protein [Vicinamibacterales bacterium]